MLQVTFRNVLPSETLLATVKAWYAALRANRHALLARFDHPAKDMCCDVVISHMERSRDCGARSRAVFEIRFAAQVVTLLADGNDPLSALQSGMFASNLALPMMRLPSQAKGPGI